MAEKRTAACTFCLKLTPLHLTKPLSCGHLTCNKCHGNFFKIKDGCPTCRKPIPLPNVEKDNEYSDYVDVAVETKKALSKQEGKVKQSQKFDRSCSIHGNVVDFFCYSCNVVACSQCLLTTHKIREHDVASFTDVSKETMKKNIEKLNDLMTLQTKLASNISYSRALTQKDEEKLKQLILDEYKGLEERIRKEKDILLDSLKKREQETASLLASLQAEHDGITSEILRTQKACQLIEKDLGSGSEPRKQPDLGSIDSKISELTHKTENLSNVPLPDNLSLNFTPHPRNISYASLRPSPRDEESYYNLPRDMLTWTAEKRLEIGELHIDYSSIVCMSSDWIVHISSLQESKFISIRHYNFDKRATARKSMDLVTEGYTWTSAKDSGHDLSILLASGENVYRISFRKKDGEMTKTFKLSFSIEAITWDEYKLDCYLLSENLRDVHCLSMDGKVTNLCSFKTAPQSAGSLTVNDDCEMHLLDRINGSIHVTSYANVDHVKELPLLKKFPKSGKFESGLLSSHSVATRRDLFGHFVLFYGDSLLTVGNYNSKFRFLQWVITENTHFGENLVDISIKDDNLAILIGTKIAMYKIK